MDELILNVVEKSLLAGVLLMILIVLWRHFSKFNTKLFDLMQALTKSTIETQADLKHLHLDHEETKVKVTDHANKIADLRTKTELLDSHIKGTTNHKVQ